MNNQNREKRGDYHGCIRVLAASGFGPASAGGRGTKREGTKETGTGRKKEKGVFL